MKMSIVEQSYNIEERAERVIREYGTSEKALSHLKIELECYEDSWSMYSSQCLGHAITCNRLLIRWIEKNVYTN